MNLRTSFFAVATTLTLSASASALPGGDPLSGKFSIDDATRNLAGQGVLTAVIDTSMGQFTCELFEKDAPNTVANFVGLARGLRPFRDPVSGEWKKTPFYDGLIFHRVIPGFMIQGGDVTGRGSGNIGYSIQDETNAQHKFAQGGMMAMANRGPNTGDSQFFITEGPTPALDDGGRAGGHYQIFGQCKEVGLVKSITRVPRDGMDRPMQEVKIKRVVIERRKGEPTAGVTSGGALPAGLKPKTAPATKPPAKPAN
jgi:peptidyl-prolyl cis-trans isomerase A (cyclophilin A)